MVRRDTNDSKKQLIDAKKVESVNVFKDEDAVFLSVLKKHQHDKIFFMNMAQKAGIYDASGNLVASYRR